MRVHHFSAWLLVAVVAGCALTTPSVDLIASARRYFETEYPKMDERGCGVYNPQYETVQALGDGSSVVLIAYGSLDDELRMAKCIVAPNGHVSKMLMLHTNYELPIQTFLSEEPAIRMNAKRNANNTPEDIRR